MEVVHNEKQPDTSPLDQIKEKISKPKVTLIDDNGLFSFKKDGYGVMCPFVPPVITEVPPSIMTNNQPSLNIQHIPCKSTCPMFNLRISDKGNVGIQTTCGCMPVNYTVTGVEQIKK